MISLSSWSELPLHRVVASCQVDAKGLLGAVDGVVRKALAVESAVDVRGLCLFEEQAGLEAVAPRRAGLRLLLGASVTALAQRIDASLASVYGPVSPLPRVLGAVPSSDRLFGFDYNAQSFHPLQWLDERVTAAVCPDEASATRGGRDAEPPRGRGYVHVLGPAGCGKTSWALNWVRQSLGEVAPGRLPRLSGWYFARRFGLAGTSAAGSERDELVALQTLISLGRRVHDLVPDETEQLLLSKDEQARYRPTHGADSDEERQLLERFTRALHALAAHMQPTARHPLLFLVDGGDEMWGPGGRYERWMFPRILPTIDQLPDHVYLVLLSRPGAHMQSAQGRAPLLSCTFETSDVDRSIRAFLDDRAALLDRRAPGDEAAALLRDERLQQHVCRASQGAFGYVAMLLQHWLPEGPQQGVDQRLLQLRRWRDEPDTLPQGVYGIRAREFLELRALDPAGEISSAEALALVTQLRWPMSRRDLIEFLAPGSTGVPPRRRPAAARRIERVLERAAMWLGESALGSGALAFGHQSMAEVALAAWRLECQSDNSHAAPDEAALAQEALTLAEAGIGSNTLGRHPDRALAWLHATLAEGLPSDDGATPGRLWQGDQPARPRVGPQDTLDPARAYELVWGPVHAMAAVAMAPEADNGAVHRLAQVASAQRARHVLIQAPYLQSAIRAQAAYAREHGAAPDALALREAYILADRLPCEDPEQTLRHRVEAALLQWHQRIAEETLQVGGMLWNLLGADEQGKAHAQRWKDSIDRPALITTLPGRPSDLARQIPATSSAVTPCGNWLVTSDGQSKTEIWDLRDGWHRAVVYLTLPWALGAKVEAIAVGQEIGIGGVDPLNVRNLFMAVVHLKQGTGALARYAGHRDRINAVSLHCRKQGGQTVWGVASGSNDNTVGLLLRTGLQIEDDAQRSGIEERARNPRRLARYAGHRGRINAVSLHCREQGGQAVWAVASGSGRTVGLLLRTGRQIEDDAQRSGIEERAPNPGLLARYAGHRDLINAVSLRCREQGGQTVWAVASGSDDYTVGLLLRTGPQIEDDAQRSGIEERAPNPGLLARYAGHRDKIKAVSLHCREQGGQTVWAVASGSDDKTVGLLLRTGREIEDEAQRSGIEERASNPGLLARYAGHRNLISAVSLHCREQGGQTVWAVASGSYDNTVGLLLRTGQQIEDDGKRLGIEEIAPIPGLLARYAGHRSWINAVSLHCREQGGQTVWAVASGSVDGTVGLLLRTGREIEDDAQRSGIEERASNSGLLARYAGHRSWIKAVSLHCREQGGQTVWAVASGSDDNTVGLLLRTGREIEDEAQRSGIEERASNSGLLARYAGHRSWIKAVSLHCREQGGQTVWAVASGSDDNTVGLLLRTGQQIEDDGKRLGIEEIAPIPGLLARYAGHRWWITAVSLHCREQGGQTVWAVASGSDDNTVGLLLRTGPQIEDDAQRSGSEEEAPNPRLLARYAGHRWWNNAVSLHCREQGGQTVWAVASGSNDHTVGLLLRTGPQIEDDAQRSGIEERPNPGLLARYAGHRNWIIAVSLHCREQGGQTVWAVASGSRNNTVGLLLRTDRQIEDDAQRSGIEEEAPNPGLLANAATGLPGSVHLRAAVSPPSLQPVAPDDTVRWFGGNATAAMVWSCNLTAPSPALCTILVCPLGHLPGFNAMDFAQAPDRIHYAIAGAVGSDVAIMPLELFLPSQ